MELTNTESLWGDGERLYVVGREALLSFDGQDWETALDEFHIRYVVGSAPDMVFAVSSFTIWYFDGQEWTPQVDSSPSHNARFWSRDASGMYAVDSDHLWYFDGQSWEVQVDVEFSSAPSELTGLAGETLEEDLLVVLVESSGTPQAHLYQGSAWSQATLPGFWSQWFKATASEEEIIVVDGIGRIVSFDGSAWSDQSQIINSPVRALTTGRDGAYYLGGADRMLLRKDGAR